METIIALAALAIVWKFRPNFSASFQTSHMSGLLQVSRKEYRAAARKYR